MSNLVVVQKKSGDIRLCVDFQNLNQLSLKYNYPLLNMEHLLQRVTGTGMMSMLDGFSRYNQVLLKREDQLKTTFTTPWRTFMYLRMSFGLMNASLTFQRAMDFAFRDPPLYSSINSIHSSMPTFIIMTKYINFFIF
jgi:hypothetical protein